MRRLTADRSASATNEPGRHPVRVAHKTALAVPRGFPPREETDERFEVALEPMGDDKPGIFRGTH